MKVTQWFDVAEEPKRNGVYQVMWDRHDSEFDSRYWDGRNWRFSKAGGISIFGTRGGEVWRGLASKDGK